MAKTRIVILATALALAAAVGWLLLRAAGDDTGGRDFRANQPSIPVEAARSSPLDSIAVTLVDDWLDHFTTAEVARAARLRDYRIDAIEVTESGMGTVVSATMSVRPTRRSFDNWLAGSGGTVDGEWIRGKFTRFALVESGGRYHLREIGPGPL
jgi:hypothetical protein